MERLFCVALYFTVTIAVSGTIASVILPLIRKIKGKM